MFGWKRDTDKRLDEIEKRIDRIERQLGISYLSDDGRIYASSTLRWSDEKGPRISDVIETLCGKAGVTFCPARGARLK